MLIIWGEGALVGKGKRVSYQKWSVSSGAEQNPGQRSSSDRLCNPHTGRDCPFLQWAPSSSPLGPNIVSITRTTLGRALRPSPGTLSLGGRGCIQCRKPAFGRKESKPSNPRRCDLEGRWDSCDCFPLDKNVCSYLCGLVRCFRRGVSPCGRITFLSSH